MSLDLLVVSIPVLDLQYPPASPAIIKACACAAGFRAETLDLNIELKHQLGSIDRFHQIQYNFESVGQHIKDTQDPVEAFFNKDHDIIRNWVDRSIELIQQKQPVWLGISVFSYKSHKAALLLCVEIKKQLPDVKIVLGGRGVTAFLLGPDHLQFVGKMKKFFGQYPRNTDFGSVLTHYGLADAVIHGDGEQAIIDLLSGKQDKKLVADVNQINLEQLPFVDFDDYDLSAYDYVNEPTIPITGSKGCVRKCTFCDIPVLWPKFKFRSGDHIAREMIHLFHKHGVKKFYMSDSLVNGSLLAFKDFISTLAEYNRQTPENAIKWVGQYITRTKSNTLNDEYYDLLKLSGGEGLTIGVESGSDSVRQHMKKQFTTADIDHEIQEFDKRNIVCVLLFFSSYPTETWNDFLDTVDMFIKYQKYCASGTVYKITLGTPYTHHPNTPLWNMQEDIGLSVSTGSDILWSLASNSELTFYERVRRRLILQEVASILKLPMSRNTPELNQMISSLELHGDKIKQYFTNQPLIQTWQDIYQLTNFENLLTPPDIQQKLKNHLTSNPDLADRIIGIHNHINDDILFDNSQYTHLKTLLIESTK
jgi:radical SAM superfamily enzyme YgiQ (UPF0313 family)